MTQSPQDILAEMSDHADQSEKADSDRGNRVGIVVRSALAGAIASGVINSIHHLENGTDPTKLSYALWGAGITALFIADHCYHDHSKRPDLDPVDGLDDGPIDLPMTPARQQH